MAGSGSATNLVKIRLIAEGERVEELAGRITKTLEEAGCEVIEWTSPYPCRAPDENKSRVYISAVRK